MTDDLNCVVAREPCDASDIQRWHGPWWNSERGRFTQVRVTRPLCQYALFSNIRSDVAFDYPWSHFSTLRRIGLRSDGSVGVCRIAVQSIGGISPARDRLEMHKAKKQDVTIRVYEGSNRKYATLVHYMGRHANAEEFVGDRCPFFMRVNEYAVITLSSAKIDAESIADALPLKYFPQTNVIPVAYLIEEVITWAVSNGYVFVTFRRDIYDMEWPVFYLSTSQQEAFRYVLDGYEEVDVAQFERRIIWPE